MIDDVHPHGISADSGKKQSIKAAYMRLGASPMKQKNKWPDICGRLMFAYFLLTAPYAALTNETSIAARTVVLDGWAGEATILCMVLVSLVVAIDAAMNAMPGGVGWRAVRRHRVFFYVAGCWLSCVAAYTPSKYDFEVIGSGWVYWGLAVWGISLALLDLFARGWAPSAAQNHT